PGGGHRVMTRVRRMQLLVTAVTLAGPAGIPRVRAAVDPAIERGVQTLRPRAAGQQVGETALIALALIKAEATSSDPTVSTCMAKIRERFAGGSYSPQRTGGFEVYEAATVAMALANVDPESSRAELGMVAQFLVSRQKANGSWDYTARPAGDTSISQYAVLGLWEAENAGAEVPAGVWDRAARWFLSTQAPAGSWAYHRDEPGQPETVSMTAAGVGSLLICRRQLQRYRAVRDTSNPLLIPLTSQGPRRRYDVETPAPRIDGAIARGTTWLGANFNPRGAIMGPSAFYGLYGIERVGALAARDSLNRVDWFEQGRRFILASQGTNGAWNASYGEDMNTVWAILFLTRSTTKTLRRIEIKRLGAGTLLGGRGLPKDLSSMTVAGGKVVSRPMNGFEGCSPCSRTRAPRTPTRALAGLVASYQARGPGALKPHKDRLRKLLGDRDPGLRRVAAWGLARTGDIDVIPALIGAIRDPDEDVVGEARGGLQLLSRKIDGLGPPSPSTPEQARASRRWRAWYDSIRPLDLEGQDPAPARPALGSRR
ncbi:MAG: HEAT repeat domain-containing protein, partial [Singulisphaera sp.]